MKKVILCICVILSFLTIHGQAYKPHELYIQLNSSNLKPDGEGQISNTAFQQVIVNYNAILEVGFPYAV